MRSLLACGLAALGLLLGSCNRTGLQPTFEWVAFASRQCGNNPWDAGASVPPAQYPIDELGRVDAYFDGVGVDLLEIGFIETAEAVCLACSCPRGDMLVARVSLADAARLVREFGFVFLFATSRHPWLTHLPIQCDGNPWEEAASPFDEARTVRVWAAGVGATVNWAGFVYQTRPFGVCLACLCPRGDRLLVSVPTDSDERVLRGFGFEGLF